MNLGVLAGSLFIAIAPIGESAPPATEDGGHPDTTTCHVSPRLLAPIGDLRLVDGSMLDGVDALRKKGILVSLESVAVEKKDFCPGPGRVYPYRHKTFSVDLTNATLEDALAALVQADPRYTWSFDDSTNMVHVFPKQGSRLNWSFKELKIVNRPLRELLIRSDDDPLGLQSRGMALVLLKGNLARFERRVSFEMSDAQIRNVLGRVVQCMSPMACYIVLVSPRGPSLGIAYASSPATSRKTAGEGQAEKRQ
ncbi:MAG: hypothetical protein JXQ73_31145 [Phycisphaerae bacterium]|nr:hypothetical protein [Phycisphaerae bacterium]